MLTANVVSESLNLVTFAAHVNELEALESRKVRGC